MPPATLRRSVGACALVVALAPLAAGAQRHITSPKEEFGFNVGDDYRLATYTQFERYWRKLATESDRMKLVEIGKTAEGRPQLMAIISTPANLAKLDRYREISRRLALGQARDSSEARALAREGRSIVWIDGGLHATEVLGAHQLIETVYQLLTRTDAETMRLLEDDVVLATHVNPDGMELVSGWYMKDADEKQRGMNIPRLYEKYAGHDNNRDFYMANLPETRNIDRQLYWEWFPQIVYNHHQTGPVGTVMFAPPFRDPFNYNYDPLVVMQLDMVGSAMHARFEAEGKPGVTMRSGSTYSTWWNGGLRTMPYFHNMVGLLTETIGNPTPTTIPFVPDQQLPRADLPLPIAPQAWHFRQSIDYSITANWAVLDVASRQRENFLFNVWKMARNSIERGSRDTWTTTPTEIESAKKLAVADAASRRGNGGGPGAGAVGDPLGGGGRLPNELFTKLLRDPAKRDPRGYVIPSDQPDFPTAVRFVNALRYGGVTVYQATAPFTVAGKQYPANSFVVKSAQPFRPHVLDMFEPQDHPNDFAYPGGPPKRPYDNAGYTLAYQMGVQFDRVLDGFDVPGLREVQGVAEVPPARIAVTGSAGYLVSHAMNNAFLAVNRALKAGADVYVLRAPVKAVGGKSYPAGTFWIASNRATSTMLQELARTRGVAYDATAARPSGDARKLRQMRVGLFDQYGGSMPSGWTRYLFEQYEFPYTLVYPKELDAGNLAAKYDVLVFPSGAIPGAGGRTRGGEFGGPMDTTTIPADLRATLGRVTLDRTVPQIRRFAEAGGTVVAVGTSSALGYHLGLPLENALVEGGRDLPAEKFYIPGSVLRVAVDTTRAVSFGVGTKGEVDVFYDNSPAFRLKADAAAQGVRPLAWFSSGTPLRSGWAWGQSYLNGAVTAAEATLGKGTVYLFGPEITFRAQPYGTFKWLFNGIYTSAQGTTAM